MGDKPARNDTTSRRHIVMSRGKYRGSDDKGTRCSRPLSAAGVQHGLKSTVPNARTAALVTFCTGSISDTDSANSADSLLRGCY